MVLRHPPNRAFCHHEALVLDQLVHRFGIGYIGTKVGYGSLQWTRAAARTYPSAFNEGAYAFGSTSVLRLFYTDVAEDGVPAEFFLPSRWAHPVRRTSCSVWWTWPVAQACMASWPMRRSSSIRRSSASSARRKPSPWASTTPSSETMRSQICGCA
jgi:hypothetical protein